jgi:hypothetical protein
MEKSGTAQKPKENEMFVFAEDGDYLCLVTHTNGPSVADPAHAVETVVTKYKVVIEGVDYAHLLPMKAAPDRFSDVARNETELKKLYQFQNRIPRKET